MSLKVVVRRDGSLGVEGAMPGRDFNVRAAGAADVGSIYDEGGLFGTCKQDPTVINAMIGPIGYEGKLLWRGTNVTTPIYQSLTYIGTTTTAQASGCADCGKPLERRCAQTACFGRICQMTNEIIVDDIGLKANQNVPRVSLFGNITTPAGETVIGMGQPITDVFFLNLAEAGYNLALDNATLLWGGNPAANAGGRREYKGFDLLINTGHIDAETGIGCDALDSYLLNYGGAVVGGLNSPSILRAMEAAWRRIKFRASRAGFDVASLITDVVMHPNQWECVAEAIACEYGLRCQQTVAATTDQDAREVADHHRRIKGTMTIELDGDTLPVTLDSQIVQTAASSGNLAAWMGDVYFITRQVNGKVITWGEFQDLNAAAPMLNWFRRNFGASHVAVTDGGRFAIAPTTAGGFCADVRILTLPRIIMLMPQLCARVLNVVCRPYGGATPDPTGSGGVYELDGGVNFWTANYLYGDCWPTHAGADSPFQGQGDPIESFP